MSVLYIDGFDLHAQTAGATLPGMEDYGLMYYTPPLNSLGYVTGYLTGQAIKLTTSPLLALTGNGGTNGNLIPTGQAVLRTSWFAKSAPSGEDDHNIWYGFMMYGIDGDIYGVQVNHQGYTRIGRGGFYPGNPVLNPTDITEEIISGVSTTPLSSSVWNYYELYMNFPTNTFQLKINGTLECSGSLDVPKTTVTDRPRPMFNRPQNLYTIFDHFIVTDGESLVGTERIHALAPTAAFGGSGTLRGNLIINDASYQTLRQGAIISPQSYGADNAENVAYYLYPNNPSTNTAWTADAISLLQGWGVCAADQQPATYLHMTSLGLSAVQTVSDPDGFPIISVTSPGGLTYYSGTWIKSHANVSVSGHVNDIPRTVLFANDKYLRTYDEGCLLFQNVPTNDLLQTLGITFAEEFREDFTDWYRLIYGGLAFESYFITGYTILGEGNKTFQSNYVSVNYENVTVGGAYLQGVWDYSLSGASGRWGTKQQIYRLSSADYKYQVAKLKVRGHGRSMQIKVTSEEGKDFKLSGWTIAASGNASV